MEKWFKILKEFFNSGLGLLVLGFIFTTIIGTYINFSVQRDLANNQRDFEIFKIRLAEAKKIQAELFVSINERVFQLGKIAVKLRKPASIQSCPQADNELQLMTTAEKRAFQDSAYCHWKNIYSPIKDKWNHTVVAYEGTLRALFLNPTANLFMSDDEDKKYDFRKDWKERLLKWAQFYGKNSQIPEEFPNSLHSNIVSAHELAFHLLFKCDLKKIDVDQKYCENREDYYGLLGEILERTNDINRCLSRAIVRRLLISPYGPGTHYELPRQCQELCPECMKEGADL